MLIRIKRNLDVLTLRATMRHLHASYCRLAATQARSALALRLSGVAMIWGWSTFCLVSLLT